MAFSRSLFAAIALATFASILLQSLATPANDRNHPATIPNGSPSRTLGPSPAPSPAPAPAPSSGAPIPRASRPPHKKGSTGANAPSPTQSGESIDFRRGKALGIALIATAGALQAAVVVFLFVKRKQMLKMERSYDMNGPSETWNDVP